MQCPICKSTRIFISSSLRYSFDKHKTIPENAECLSCHHKFKRNIPTEGEFTPLYTTKNNIKYSKSNNNSVLNFLPSNKYMQK